jgi:hypothetical protein
MKFIQPEHVNAQVDVWEFWHDRKVYDDVHLYRFKYIKKPNPNQSKEAELTNQPNKEKE